MDCYLPAEYSKANLLYQLKEILSISDIAFLSSINLQERSR
jgi:hypothetical protein